MSTPLLACLLAAWLVPRFVSSAPAISSQPTVRLRALAPGVQVTLFGRYLAQPFSSQSETFGYLYLCQNCCDSLSHNAPWTLLTFLQPSQLEGSLNAAVRQRAAAVIVIVRNLLYDPILIGHFLAKLSLEDDAPGLAVVAVDEESGGKLAQLVRTNSKVPVYFSVQEGLISDQILFPVLLSMLVIFIIVCVYAFSVCGKNENNNDSGLSRCPIRLALSKIPIQVLSNKQDPVCDEENKCAVCIEGYLMEETVSILPCTHVFHRDCIEPWLLTKRVCPMCKMDVIRFYGPIHGGSEESILDIPLDEILETREDSQSITEEEEVDEETSSERPQDRIYVQNNSEEIILTN